MSRALVVQGGDLSGTLPVPGDKSISHRALLLAAAAAGSSRIRALAPGEDVAATARCLSAYGVEVRQDRWAPGSGPRLAAEDCTSVAGGGIASWSPPPGVLDCGNSGTTMRVLAGLAARLPFWSQLDGDASLRRRPMDRVAAPLRALGAELELRDGRWPPVKVRGGALHSACIDLPVASAQVKSAVLLAALGAEGRTRVTEPAPSRDHTERMLAALGAPIRCQRLAWGGVAVEVEPFELPPFDLQVPGDPSSAAFLVAAAILCGSVRVEGVCLNPTRAGFYDLLAEMGADLRLEVTEQRMGEPVGWVEASRSELRAARVQGPSVPAMVDELPLVAVLATQARGETVVRGAGELRVKESDRIAALAEGLGRMGARITPLEDGFAVEGPTPLRFAEVSSWGDHRIAMALAVAGLAARGGVRVRGAGCIDVSWPGFPDALRALGAQVVVQEA